MKTVKQEDDLFTIEAAYGKILEHKHTHLRQHLAADQTKTQINDWQEIDK